MFGRNRADLLSVIFGESSRYSLNSLSILTNDDTLAAVPDEGLPVSRKNNINRKSDCWKLNKWLHSRQTIPPTSTLQNSRNNNFCATRFQQTLKEQQIPLEGFDKIFNSCWLPMPVSYNNNNNNNHNNDYDNYNVAQESAIVLSTKCNRLLLMRYDSTRHDPLTELYQLNKSESQQQESQAQALNSTGGIHALAVNPSGTLLAAGSADGFEIIIYRLPDLERWLILRGHTDTVFSCQWINDRQLVSGSRDHHVCHWQLPEDLRSISRNISPVDSYQTSNLVSEQRQMVCEHSNKVRALQVNRRMNEFMTLSLDGTCKLWDVERMRPSSTIPLLYTNETVCMAVEEWRNLYAVGSQHHITLIDPRLGRFVRIVESCDEKFGVRSLAWQPNIGGLATGSSLSSNINSRSSLAAGEPILAAGGGLGRLSFYDWRAGRYLQIDQSTSNQSLVVDQKRNSGSSGSNNNSSNGQAINEDGDCGSYNANVPHGEILVRNPLQYCLQTGAGWLHRDRNYYITESLGHRVASAVYSLSYSPNGDGRLFAAGGPLQLGLKGSYAAIWE